MATTSDKFRRGQFRRGQFRAVVAFGVLVYLVAGSGIASASPRRTPVIRTTASAQKVVHLSGSGSTFDAPFFDAAFSRYHQLNPGVSVSYAAVGSSTGIKRFSANTVNFGASDVPMTVSEQRGAVGGRVLQIPIDLGAVVISYNLLTSPLSEPLRLTGPVLARIFLGQITDWNDPAISALNPGVQLPNESITVVHRSDGSGTTYIFTNYLSSASSSWASGPGTNKSINWPVGKGAKGSAGIAAVLQRTPGSIGYFELSYAETKNLPYFAIENRSGAFVPPFSTNVAADASMKSMVTASDFSIVNESGDESYPISGYSWVLLYLHQPSFVVGSTLAKLLAWMTGTGQSVAAANFYVPLPQSIQLLAAHTLGKLRGPRDTPIAP